MKANIISFHSVKIPFLCILGSFLKVKIQNEGFFFLFFLGGGGGVC